MISVLDYGAGNIGSVIRMFERAGGEAQRISTVEEITESKKLVIPGVGAFDFGMSHLISRGLLPALNSAAIQRRIPILGICRGMQFMNISLGGTMLQDITPLQAAVEHNFSDGPPEHVAHRVVTEEGSLARSIYGESTWTTSSHHQAVDDLGRDLRVTGRADDGVIEILEHTSLPWLGVQWHAEWQEPIDSAFRWLVQATHTASAEGE